MLLLRDTSDPAPFKSVPLGYLAVREKRSALLHKQDTQPTYFSEWTDYSTTSLNAASGTWITKDKTPQLHQVLLYALLWEFQMKYEWAPPRTSSNVSSCSRENRALWLSSHLSWWVRRNSLNVCVTCGTGKEMCGRRSVEFFFSVLRSGVQQ